MANPDEDASVVRHEEELRVATAPIDAGGVRARKHVETDRFVEDVPRDVEHAETERTGPFDNDSGEIETLPDGSVSIPVFEEEILVTKRVVVRERILIRKTTRTERRRVEADVRKERVDVEIDEEDSETGAR
jgi:uncharacterized protein (TIGR02271 family)